MRGNCHVGILCYRELGIGIVPYSPLGRGFFGGKASVESLPASSILVCFSLQCFIGSFAILILLLLRVILN